MDTFAIDKTFDKDLTKKDKLERKVDKDREHALGLNMVYDGLLRFDPPLDCHSRSFLKRFMFSY